MTYEEAIKRLRQETCPATYNKDFDKEACIRVIEERVRKQNEILRILKDGLSPYIGSNERREIDICCDIRGTGDLYPETFIKLKYEDFEILKKWLEEEK